MIPNSGHIVPYSVDLGVIVGSARLETIGRVFSVYLLDPSTTTEPFETPFDLLPEGVFVGFEHGPAVWIKYIPACPQFTSTPWVSDATYGRGNLTYLPLTGECYKSRTPNNKGHDPSVLFSPQPNDTDVGVHLPLTTEITQERALTNPGMLQVNEILRVSLLSMSPGPDPVDPPPSGSFWSIVTLSDVGGHAGIAVHTANGTETLAAITTAMAADLSGDLAGFGYTVTADTINNVITITGPESFQPDIHCIYTPPGGSPVSRLKVVISQPFVPAVTAVDPVPQLSVLTVTSANVSTGATYQVVFTDPFGVQHMVEYTATSTDSMVQILHGLSVAIETARATDAFFDTVAVSIDTVLNTLTFSTIDEISVDANVGVPASAWWELVQFPQALADPIIRGEVSDIYREEGQTDRADGEEKKVETELGVAASKFTAPESDQLTNQQKSKSRYSIK